jgi:hypothetical protein
MGFILGLLMGLLAAIGLVGFLACWLCSRSDNVAVAKFINGLAKALAHKQKSSEPLTRGENGNAGEPVSGTRKEKQGRDRP